MPNFILYEILSIVAPYFLSCVCRIRRSFFLDSCFIVGIKLKIIQNFFYSFSPQVFNYFAEWEEVLRGGIPSVDDKLNIVIMADGFTSIELGAGFHLEVNRMIRALRENNFFGFHINEGNINVFRLNTVSLGGNQDIIGVNDRARFGDYDRIRRIIQTSFVGGPLTMNNIDVIVIVRRNAQNSSLTYHGEISRRNGQPINIIVTNGTNLPHLLGHALARLQDEEPGACHYGNIEFGWVGDYQLRFRNVHRLGNENSFRENGFKWQQFIDLGYEIWNRDNRSNGFGTTTHPIRRNLFSPNDTIFVPSFHSTIGRNAWNHVRGTAHFCPVSFYHLQASFLVRTGAIRGVEPHYTGNNDWEWAGYRISAFYRDFPPNHQVWDGWR